MFTLRKFTYDLDLRKPFGVQIQPQLRGILITKLYPQTQATTNPMKQQVTLQLDDFIVALEMLRFPMSRPWKP